MRDRGLTQLVATPTHGRGLRNLALVYIFCTPLDIVPFPVGSPALVTGAVFLLVWLVALARGAVRVPRSPNLLIVLVLLPLWSFTTVFWSYAPAVSLVQSTSTLMLAISAIALASVLQGEVRGAAASLALGSALAGCLAILNGPAAIVDSGGLVTVTEQYSFLGLDQNALAFGLSLGLAAALYASLRWGNLRLRIGFIGLALILVWSLLLVGSRTGLGSTIAIGVVFLLVSLRSARASVGALLGGLATLVLVRLLAEARLVPLRLVEWLQQPIAMDSRAEIIEVYRATMSEWILHGVGAGADADYLFATGSWYRNAHSAFWKIWIETGLVGLMLWMLLLIGIAYWVYRSRDRFFFLLVLPPIVFFFFTLGPMNSNALWVVFGVALGAAYSPRQRENGGRPLSSVPNSHYRTRPRLANRSSWSVQRG